MLIRAYNETTDAQAVGQLIADTFSKFNLGFASPDELPLFLGPFRNAYSTDPEHQNAIAAVIYSDTVLVAEDQAAQPPRIAGVLRGRPGRLASLFVHADYQRKGVGAQLVNRFEEKSRAQGVVQIKVAATLFAIPFYKKMGYRRTTGVRRGGSFEGRGLPYQPMKKAL